MIRKISDRSCYHDLKTWPEPFRAVAVGQKRFEFRKDDRGYKVGDMLRLLRWCPHAERYDGEYLVVEVEYILRGPEFGVPDGYCVMSIKDSLEKAREIYKHDAAEKLRILEVVVGQYIKALDCKVCCDGEHKPDECACKIMDAAEQSMRQLLSDIVGKPQR